MEAVRASRATGLTLTFLLVVSTGVGASSTAATDLVGVWEARRSFGPAVRGELTLERDGERWTAEIGAHRVDATAEGCWISFEIPGDRGSFRGCLESGGPIVGHWTQPSTRHSGMRAASPVVLEPTDRRRWRGEVVPFEDDFTYFLVVEERDDGTAGAFLRNPERNFGIFMNADRLELEGDEVRLIGRWFRSEEETVLSTGRYSPDLDSFTLMIRGRTYDFDRVGDDPASEYFARGRDPEAYRYLAPPALADGWEVGTLADVGMSLEPLREMVETEIDPPARSVHALYVHGVLIARHGKLVFEDYFHGFHRGRSHDTRSASKSATSFLVGAAIQAGEIAGTDLPVYETIGGDRFGAGLEPLARRVTLEHLLTMSSGLDCDDRDPDSPGNEDRLQSQSENPDWYDYTLGLDMIRAPGERAVYCSAGSNLVGNVLAAASGERLEDLFHRLVASPLDIDRYHLYLQPTGEPYMGGGIHWMPRDFLKLGQVILDGGAWNGRRILSEEFAARSISDLYELRERGYGYLWWTIDVPFRDRSVEVFFAGGNGGQVVMGVPELELLVSFFAGNYSDRVMFRIQEELVPEYVLRAIVEE